MCLKTRGRSCRIYSGEERWRMVTAVNYWKLSSSRQQRGDLQPLTFFSPLNTLPPDMRVDSEMKNSPMWKDLMISNARGPHLFLTLLGRVNTGRGDASSRVGLWPTCGAALPKIDRSRPKIELGWSEPVGQRGRRQDSRPLNGCLSLKTTGNVHVSVNTHQNLSKWRQNLRFFLHHFDQSGCSCLNQSGRKSTRC